MYVTNIDQMNLAENKLYKCGAGIGNFLVYECRIPLLGKDADGKYCFMKTEALEKALDMLPIWYKIQETLFRF
jgi:hypothetical protein